LILLLWLLLAVAALPLAGLLYQAFGSWRDRRRFPPPGRIVAGVHVHETGYGTTPVILEAGIAASSVSWSRVQSGASQFARVVSYDRAGLGWSAPHRTPRHAAGIARELRETLQRAGIAPPYILCGHSFGGLVVRLYAAMFPDDVQALVLVDPVNAQEWAQPTPEALYRLARGVRFSRRGAWLARFGVVRFALALMMAGARSLPKLIARASSSGTAAGMTERLVGEVRKLPAGAWPVVRAHWCRPKAFLSMSSHLAELPASAASLDTYGALPGIPVTLILAAANATPDPTLHCPRLTTIVAPRSGHWVHLDEPEIVVEAIRSAIRDPGSEPR
jgi:pimeloyl-ACP methyl ester carboxylesterase